MCVHYRSSYFLWKGLTWTLSFDFLKKEIESSFSLNFSNVPNNKRKKAKYQKKYCVCFHDKHSMYCSVDMGDVVNVYLCVSFFLYHFCQVVGCNSQCPHVSHFGYNFFRNFVWFLRHSKSVFK